MEAEPRRGSADLIGDVARRQVAIVALDHSSISVAKIRATTMSGIPAITESDAQVWRSV